MQIITNLKLCAVILRDFPKQVALRGFIDAIRSMWYNIMILYTDKKRPVYYALKHKLNLKFVECHFALDKYIKQLPLPEIVNDKEYYIWVCWWQGEEQMPPIIKATYHSILANTNGKKVILITSKNYQEYIDIPEYIMRKALAGKMMLAHVSDFIRMSLLDKYGGMWIDSTILMTKQMPDQYFHKGLFTIQDLEAPTIPFATKYVPAGRWNCQVLGTNVRHYPLFFLMREIWIDYWNKNNSLIDYLLVDYTICHIANQLKQVQKDIEHLPHTNKHMHELRPMLNTPYSEKVFDSLEKDTCLFKLTYKGNFYEKQHGQETFYAKILKIWT